jgi:hypothetical protein
MNNRDIEGNRVVLGHAWLKECECKEAITRAKVRPQLVSLTTVGPDEV